MTQKCVPLDLDAPGTIVDNTVKTNQACHLYT